MARGRVSEPMAFLRRRIAAIESRGAAFPAAPRLTTDAASPARSDETGIAQEPLAALLDAGPFGLFSEIVPATPRDAGAATAFACALALRGAALRPGAGLVFVVEDMAAREIGLPYARGFEAAGLDPDRIVIVRARRSRDVLWALEEGLKTPGLAAVVGETWLAPSAYGLAASRRLTLAARRGGALAMLLMLRGSGAPGRLSSAAPLRFEAAATPSRTGPLALSPLSAPPPGPFAWRLRVVKARAGTDFGGLDPLLWRSLRFDPEQAVFRHGGSNALPGRVPAASVDGQDVAAARRKRA